MKVKKVTVCSGMAIDSIQFTLVDGLGNLITLEKNGNNGGACSDWAPNDNERINTVYFHLILFLLF